MVTSRKMTLLLTSELTAAILGWLAIKLILVYMGQRALGELAFALSLVGSFTFIGLLGFRQAHVKRISEGQDLGRCIGTFAAIRIGLLAMLALIVLSALGIWLYVLDKPLTDVSAGLILIILVYYLLFFVNGVPNATFVARQETAKTAIPTLIGNIIRLGIMCVVAVMVHKGIVEPGLGVLWLGNAYILGISVTLIISFILLRKYPIKKPEKEYARSYYKFARPLMFVMIVTSATNYFDKVVLGIFSNTRELGAFYGIQRLVLILLALVTAVETLLFPQLSAMHAKGDTRTNVRERVHQVERWLALISIPIVAVFWALPKPTILVLLSSGVANENGYLLLRLLSLMVLLRIFLRPYRIVLRAIDRPDLAARVGLVQGLGTIILIGLLVPGHIPYLGGFTLGGMGSLGAAWALLMTTALALVIAQFETYRQIRLHSSYRILYMIFSGFAVSSILYVLANTITIEGWWMLGLASLFGLGLFWGMMAMLRQVSIDDLKQIWGAVHPKEMGKYMTKELKG